MIMKFDHNKKILVAPIKHINNKIINKIKIKANFLNSSIGFEKLKNKLSSRILDMSTKSKL